MRAIEITRNGLRLCAAGTPHASLITVHVNLFVEEPKQGKLRVSGMNDLGDNRSSHTYWLEEEPLHAGDVLGFRFVETESPTSPASEVATDSPKYIAEQTWYQSEIESASPEPRRQRREWPTGSLLLTTADGQSVRATFEGGREFITMSLMWNQWRPDTCRVSLSSFSQAEAVARTGSREWFLGKLQLEQKCEAALET